MVSSTTSPPTHILVIPFPAHGHILPLLDLTHHLLTHGGDDITVTVVVTAKNREFLQPLLSSHPSTTISALILPFPTNTSLPTGIENTGELPPSYFHSFIAALPALRVPLLKWVTTHPIPPSIILSDYLLSWTHELASQLGIKRVVYSPGGFSVALTCTVRNRFPPLPRAENGEIDENAVVSVDDFPGKTEFSCWELLPLYRAFGCTNENHDAWRREILKSNVESWGFVFNTFSGLESVYLGQMKNLVGHDRIWAVGPVGCGPKVKDESGPNDKVMSWLDTCKDGEVVYVSFGHLVMPTQEQVDVLATALEKSGVKFVWKVKELSLGHVASQMFGKLPPGFEERVAGRGIILRKWAPQVAILKHRAVATFLTHCGWNAVIEGLNAEVLHLAWPLVGDQVFNAKLVVDMLKVGILVGQGMSWLIPNVDELAKILVDSVSGNHYKEERSRAVELRKETIEATTENGSSFKEFDLLVEHFIRLPKPNQEVIRKCKRWIQKEDE